MALPRMGRSGLLKFKVLKQPLINTSDGAKAVIFKNNSNNYITPGLLPLPLRQIPALPRPRQFLTLNFKSNCSGKKEERGQEITLWKDNGNSLETKIG